MLGQGCLALRTLETTTTLSLLKRKAFLNQKSGPMNYTRHRMASIELPSSLPIPCGTTITSALTLKNQRDPDQPRNPIVHGVVGDPTHSFFLLASNSPF